jgi:dipeptidyl aminopeptidase/acylaminoacyl peptidase
MQAQSPPRPANNVLSWVIPALGVALLLLLLISFMAETPPPATNDAASTATGRVAYIEFGANADTLWLANATDPGKREKVLSIPHAAEYGVLPSVSPDGKRFAYTALPEGLGRPKPDSPAGLWVSAFEGGAEPRLLAEGVDLLVAPVWTPDGASVVYRRSTDTEHVLAVTSPGEEERIIASSENEALFPVGFTPAGGLYFTGLNERGGTHLYEVSLETGLQREVATLSAGLTRDWKLSPDGSRVAFLEIGFSGADVASRAAVLDLATGAVAAVTASDEVALGPTWSKAGVLAVGVFEPRSGEASVVVVDGASRIRLSGPASGFDIPLAYDATTGSYLVRTFENDSLVAPGRSAFVLIGPEGERRRMAEGELSLVGWIRP